MALPLEGVKVVEVAGFVMVPAAAGILADWGAEVIKVEHPVTGDPHRGLVTGPAIPGYNSNYQFDSSNRSKRSIGLDIGNPAGKSVLYKLVERADVFITNFLPIARHRLEIDVEHLRAINPELIYARGSGLGPRGDERTRGGFDHASFWARGGVGHLYHHPDLDYPLMQNGGFGDLITAAILAGGIGAAVARRALGNGPSVVDASLLATGSWLLSRELASAAAGRPVVPLPQIRREAATNPLANTYRTSDNRFLVFCGIQSDRNWAEVCQVTDVPELTDDPRFATAAARARNNRECIALLDKAFASRTFDEWKQLLAEVETVWEPVQTPQEMLADPQVVANDYVVDVADAPPTGAPRVVAAPVQFEERTAMPRRSPEHAEQTEEVLLELGYDWDDITRLKDDGAVA